MPMSLAFGLKNEGGEAAKIPIGDGCSDLCDEMISRFSIDYERS